MVINGINQWFDLMLDLLSLTFIIFLIIYTTYYKEYYTAEVIGIMLTYWMNLQRSLIHGLHVMSFFENSMVGIERCLQYTNITSEEDKKKKIDETLINWPLEGKIEFINFSARYRPDTDIVLKKINFEILPKQKIGIAGRTGSGKSTITLCLFRILEALEGKILIDDVDISTIGLDKLRSNLTIIPQDPALMEGTLRYNIDPLNNYQDNEILNVMEKIGFDYIVNNNDKGLNQKIEEGGENLSVGEKQLICITRAILRKSKIIVMDEATANIDYKTEEIIQKAISEILEDSTIITIAHRIKTIINYDKILILDNGSVVNFDSPNNLLKNKEGIFYELYTKSTL
jgi:ATP-binding cassette subfamily C (CFTR/MRP) protein 1